MTQTAKDRLSAIRGYIRYRGYDLRKIDRKSFYALADEYFGRTITGEAHNWYMQASDVAMKRFYTAFTNSVRWLDGDPK